jgi:hypothetical protein
MSRPVHGLILLLAVPLSACGSSYDCDGTPVDKQLTIATPADPPLQLRVESCRVDIDACPALCSLAMERAQIHYSPESCEVGFAGDTVRMKVHYTSYDNSNCFFGDDVAPVPGQAF